MPGDSIEIKNLIMSLQGTYAPCGVLRGPFRK